MDSEEVVCFAFVPVVGWIDLDQRRQVRIGIRDRYFETKSTIVGYRHQRKYRMQFSVDLLRIVNATDAQTQFESKFRLVPEGRRHREKVFASNMQGELAAEDHDRFHCFVERRVEPGE